MMLMYTSVLVCMGIEMGELLSGVARRGRKCLVVRPIPAFVRVKQYITIIK